MDINSLYSDCTLCPNMCHVDRTKGEKGVCAQSSTLKIAWAGLHRGEEPPITGEKGSGMVFFTGCTLHCAYCQNIQISGATGENWGIEITLSELENIFLDLQQMGATTLNLVTGTHFIPSIILALDDAKKKGFSLPVVWNSSGYERVETMDLIDSYIDLYLMDAKTLSRNVASVFCGRKSYCDYIIPLLDYLKSKHPETDVFKLKGVLVRHLVFPGTVFATKKFLKYYAEKYKDNFALSLMVQFVPPRENPGFEIITDEECEELNNLLEELEIDTGFVQEKGADDPLWIPDFTLDRPFPPSFADPSPLFLEIKKERLNE